MMCFMLQGRLMNFMRKNSELNESIEDQAKGNFLFRVFQHIDLYVLFIIILSLYIPLIGVNLYFRHDDAGTLLWAMDFKRSIFYAFDPRPWFNEFNFYNGVGGYYRPFESLYIMLLVKIFGPIPFYFQLINGIMVIATIFFMYKIATMLTNRLAGLLSVIIFHLAFQSLLYGTYHVVVPFGFFFEIITFYLFIKGLRENNLKTILFGFLVMIPGTNRQTTALILTAIVIAFFVFHWSDSKFNIKQRLLIFFLAILPNALIPLTKNSSHATILNQPFSIAGYANYFWERFFFYSNLMTSRLTGFIILTVIFAYWFTGLANKNRFSRLNSKLTIPLALLLSLVVTGLALKIQFMGIVTLYATLSYFFFANKKLQPILTWFFVSLGLFSIINFYHDAYFLEAAFALAIVAGILLFDSIEIFSNAFAIQLKAGKERLVLIAASCLVLVMGIVIWKVPFLPVIGKKVEAVKLLIETNKNFERMMNYLAEELPAGAKVFQLSEEYLGLTMNERRFLSLRARAENVKVINILDSNVIIKVFGRWDVEFKHAEGLTLGIPENCVFIVHNKFEQQVAERKFDLQPIQMFQNKNTEAGIYKVMAIKEDL